MTTIDFYTHCTDRFEVAAKLVAKAWTQHGSARVLTPDPESTDRFDHCRLDSTVAAETPVVVDHALTHEGPAAVLVNLHPSPPPFFSRFERLVEVIGMDEDEAAAGRERWKFYRARGYEVRSHNLAERG